jgi:hypothetical protein
MKVSVADIVNREVDHGEITVEMTDQRSTEAGLTNS